MLLCKRRASPARTFPAAKRAPSGSSGTPCLRASGALQRTSCVSRTQQKVLQLFVILCVCVCVGACAHVPVPVHVRAGLCACFCCCGGGCIFGRCCGGVLFACCSCDALLLLLCGSGRSLIFFFACRSCVCGAQQKPQKPKHSFPGFTISTYRDIRLECPAARTALAASTMYRSLGTFLSVRVCARLEGKPGLSNSNNLVVLFLFADTHWQILWRKEQTGPIRIGHQDSTWSLPGVSGVSCRKSVRTAKSTLSSFQSRSRSCHTRVQQSALTRQQILELPVLLHRLRRRVNLRNNDDKRKTHGRANSSRS